MLNLLSFEPYRRFAHGAYALDYALDAASLVNLNYTDSAFYDVHNAVLYGDVDLSFDLSSVILSLSFPSAFVLPSDGFLNLFYHSNFFIIISL